MDGKITWSGGVWSRAGVFWKCLLVFVSNSQSWRWFLVFGLIRSAPLSMGWLKVWATCAFIFPAEFTTSWLIWTAGGSFGGGTLGAPFLSRILRFFCCYVTNFKGYFLFGCLFGCGSNLRRGSFITFILRGVHAWCAWAVLRGSSWLAGQVKNSGFGHMLAARLLSPL